MKTLNLIILVLLPIFFSCKNEQKEKEKQIAQLVSECKENKLYSRKTQYLPAI